LHASDITPGNVKCPALVVADFTDARLAFRDWAAMSTGVTADTIPINLLVQLAFADVLIQDFT